MKSQTGAPYSLLLGYSFKNKLYIILTGFLLMAFSQTAVAGVTTLSVTTDASWKCLDFENDGWNSENYDDSWWASAEEVNWDNGKISPSKMIWYPGSVKPAIAYFRNVFEIDGTEILNGKLYTTTHNSGGTLYLFVNGYSIPKIVNGGIYDPTGVDITSYLKPGKNVIAAKVKVTSDMVCAWGLIGTIRYNQLTPGQPIN